MKKVQSIRDAIRSIVDGEQVAIGGHSHRRHPMALLYEVVRQGKRNLQLIGWNNGIDVDLLVGANCVAGVQTSYVGMGKFGLALNFRRAAEAGLLSIVEDSENTALERFRAGAMGISFIPSNGPLGSGLMDSAETMPIYCPFTGKPMAALRAAQPDVALIHAHAADEKGNVQLDERYLMDNLADINIARSAKRVIVSVEELVTTAQVMEHPARTILPGFLVDMVVVASHGAHPCACDLRYDYDLDFMAEYHQASQNEVSFRQFITTYVTAVEDHAGYLRVVADRSPLQNTAGTND
jgi:glutaconate CoA-transferase subunit A